MKNNPYSFKSTRSTCGFSVSVSADLILNLLSCFYNFFLDPKRTSFFTRIFSGIIGEFTDKLSPLVINKRLYHKRLLGAKITFYYED